MRTVLAAWSETMPPLLRKALVVSLTGTFTLFLLGCLLGGLVGSWWDLTFCFIGAFSTVLCFARSDSDTFWANLRPATAIVFGTFAWISLGYALHQALVRHVSVDFEPIGEFVWATLVTSWWLIPGTATILTLLGKFQKRNS